MDPSPADLATHNSLRAACAAEGGQPVTVKQIAQLDGRSDGVIQRHLNRLAAQRLARRVPGEDGPGRWEPQWRLVQTGEGA